MSKNSAPWYIDKAVRFCPAFMYRTFCKVGLTFYNKMAIKGDGKAAFFAENEWNMGQGMTDYLDEGTPADEKTIHNPEILNNGLK